MKGKKAHAKSARRPGARERPAPRHVDAGGRVHLGVLRDASGQNRVVLRAPVFKEEWQNNVTAATANTAYAVLADEPTLARTVELARNAMAATSRLADGLLARAPAGAVACRAGCDHCCYQVVGVTPPEALAIVDHLKRTLKPEELAGLVAHVLELHESARGLTPAERFSPEHPCVFLRDGRCSIYEVRQLSCRGMNSLDADECSKRLRDPEARAEFIESGVSGHSFMEPIRAFHSISAGLQLALSELYRLDMRPLELLAAMRLLLAPDAPSERAWLAGEPAYAAARANDRSHEPAMRELSGMLEEKNE